MTCPGYCLITGGEYTNIFTIVQVNEVLIPTAAALVSFDPTFTDLKGFILINNHWFYSLVIGEKWIHPTHSIFKLQTAQRYTLRDSVPSRLVSKIQARQQCCLQILSVFPYC